MLFGIGRYGIIGISNGRGGDMPTFTDPESIEWYGYPALAENPHGKQWIKSEALLGLAPNTIDAYARGVDDFLAFCQRAEVNLLTASKGDLARYVGDLRQRPGSQKTHHELRNKVDGASSLWSSNYPCDRAGLGGGMTIPLTESQITPMIQNPSFPASQSTPTAVGAFS